MDQWGEMYRDRAEKAEAEIERLRSALRAIKEMGEGKISSLPLMAWKIAHDALEQNAEGYHPLDKDPKPY